VLTSPTQVIRRHTGDLWGRHQHACSLRRETFPPSTQRSPDASTLSSPITRQFTLRNDGLRAIGVESRIVRTHVPTFTYKHVILPRSTLVAPLLRGVVEGEGEGVKEDRRVDKRSRAQTALSVMGKVGVAMPVAEAVVTADWSVTIPWC